MMRQLSFSGPLLAEGPPASLVMLSVVLFVLVASTGFSRTRRSLWGFLLNKRLILSLLAGPLICGAPVLAHADQLVPAGSVITCTIAESKVSSQTEKVGDPVLCTLGHTEAYGRASFPYGSYLVGHFQEYKDPGHFVGKGWMELAFDRMIVQPDTIVPINARVVAAPGYKVDVDGKILGKGHAVRDTIMWLIPVLWPIDLINLPRRGPRPFLKPESKLTLKVLDDFGIPTPMENSVRTPAVASRITPDEPTYQGLREQAPALIQRQPLPQPVQQSYAPQPAPVQYVQQPQQTVYRYAAAPQVVYVQPPPPRVVYLQPPPPRVVYGYPGYPPPGYRGGPY